MRDAFIVDYIRTPIGRYGGALSSMRTDDLGAVPIKALIERNPSLDPADIDDVFYGCANQAGEDNRNVARMSLLLAGLPANVAGVTVNRLCGSGLEATAQAARAIKTGEVDIAIAGGVESMSRAPFVMPKADTPFSRATSIEDTTIGWRFVNARMHALYGTDSMPETAENVADEFSISRQDQDAFALRSQQRAVTAQQRGVFAEEIVPIEISQRKKNTLIVDQDEHIRSDTTLEMLGRLRAPFREDGVVTAGNASGVNDGAAALLIASRDACEKLALEPIAKVLGYACTGVPPRIMGIGPAPATQKICRKLSLDPSEFDVIELNEAFASQALAVLRELNIADADEHVNPNGGAIALGHPLGMSGARLAGTAALELRRRGGRYGLATMCIGVGQGAALVIENAVL